MTASNKGPQAPKNRIRKGCLIAVIAFVGVITLLVFGGVASCTFLMLNESPPKPEDAQRASTNEPQFVASTDVQPSSASSDSAGVLDFRSHNEGPLVGKNCKVSLVEQDTIYSYHPANAAARYAYKTFDVWCDTTPPKFPQAFKEGIMTTLSSGTRVKAVEYIKPLYKVQVVGKPSIWWLNENDLEIGD